MKLWEIISIIIIPISSFLTSVVVKAERKEINRATYGESRASRG